MIPLNYLTVHKVSGADAGSFLHAQLAADTAALADGQSCFAAYCSPRGQVIALLLVCRQADNWTVITQAGLASLVANRLRMYVLRAKVTIEAMPGKQVAGLFSNEDSAAGAVVFSPANVPLRYALTVAHNDDRAMPARWRRAEIMHGVIWLQNGTSERFLPQMLGLDAIGAVSFSKGCYPGQEIVARTRYLGKLKRKPVLLEADGVLPLNPGDNCTLISDGDKIEAVVADAVGTRDTGTTLLAVAPVEPDRPVNTLEWNAQRWPVRRAQSVADD